MAQVPADFPANSSGAGEPSRSGRRRQLPAYKVILIHDARNDLMFIVRTVMELTHFCRAEATHKMWEAHHCGRSILFRTYRERAEFYQEQFAHRGLAVTLEPAEPS